MISGSADESLAVWRCYTASEINATREAGGGGNSRCVVVLNWAPNKVLTIGEVEEENDDDEAGWLFGLVVWQGGFYSIVG